MVRHEFKYWNDKTDPHKTVMVCACGFRREVDCLAYGSSVEVELACRAIEADHKREVEAALPEGEIVTIDGVDHISPGPLL